jgi:nucleoside-diphosphate-sugar epimerase
MPYGSGLPAGRGRAAIINFLYNALHGLPLTVHRDSERSWCWIGDTVRAVRLLLEQTDGGAYNIGRDDNAVPMRRVAEMACDLVGAPHSLIEEIDAPGRQTVVKRLATQKIRDLGWSPEVSLEDGMARTLDWVRELPAPLAAAA